MHGQEHLDEDASSNSQENEDDLLMGQVTNKELNYY